MEQNGSNEPEVNTPVPNEDGKIPEAPDPPKKEDKMSRIAKRLSSSLKTNSTGDGGVERKRLRSSAVGTDPPKLIMRISGGKVIDNKSEGYDDKRVTRKRHQEEDEEFSSKKARDDSVSHSSLRVRSKSVDSHYQRSIKAAPPRRSSARSDALDRPMRRRNKSVGPLARNDESDGNEGNRRSSRRSRLAEHEEKKNRSSVEPTKQVAVIQQKTISNKDNSFCWMCHNIAGVLSCNLCPRIYHLRCVSLTKEPLGDWVCPECSVALHAETVSTRSEAMKSLSLEQLCKLLSFTLERMKSVPESLPFWKAIYSSEDAKLISYPMDLSILEQNIKQLMYGSTQAFLADAKWLTLNSVILNSRQSPLTNVARNLVKICKQELSEIDNCPDCYLNAHTADDWFLHVCRTPHILVWARLRGFPFWPAKALTTNLKSQMVDARFFGAHDKAWVPVKECYLLSKSGPPSSGKKRTGDMEVAFDELTQHINRIKEKYGSFVYAKEKTPFQPENSEKQLQSMIPKWGLNPSKLSRPRTKKMIIARMAVVDETGAEERIGHERLTAEEEITRNLELMAPRQNMERERESYEDSTDTEELTVQPPAASFCKTPEHGYSRNNMETSNQSTGQIESSSSEVEASADSVEGAAIIEQPSTPEQEPEEEKRDENVALQPTVISIEDTDNEKEEPPDKNDVEALDPLLAEALEVQKKVTEPLPKEDEKVLEAVSESGSDLPLAKPDEVRAELSLEKNVEQAEKELSPPLVEINATPDKASDLSQEQVPDQSSIDSSAAEEQNIEIIDKNKNVQPDVPIIETQEGTLHVVPISERNNTMDTNKDSELKKENVVAVSKSMGDVTIEPINDNDSVNNSISDKSVKLVSGATDKSVKTKKRKKLQAKEVVELEPEINLAEILEVEVKQENYDQYLEEENQEQDNLLNLQVTNIRSEAPPPMLTIVDVARLNENGASIEDSKPKASVPKKTKEKIDDGKLRLSDEVSIVVLDGEKSPKKGEPPARKPIARKAPAKARKSIPPLRTDRENAVTISTSSNDIAFKGGPPPRPPVNIIAVDTQRSDAQKKMLKSLVSDDSKKKNGPLPRPPPPSNDENPGVALFNNAFLISPSTHNYIGDPSRNIAFTQNTMGQISFVQIPQPHFLNIGSEPLAMSNSFGGQAVYTTGPAPCPAPCPPLSSFSHPSASGSPTVLPSVPLEDMRKSMKSGLISVKSAASMGAIPIPTSSSNAQDPHSPKTDVTSLLRRHSQKIFEVVYQSLETLLKEMAKDGSVDAKLLSFAAEKDRMHQAELENLRRAHERTLAETKAHYENEKMKTMSELRVHMDKVVAETKRKQWCAHCGKEALFYCCWNTSYCDLACQRQHWSAHMSSCVQVSNNVHPTSPQPQHQPKRPNHKYVPTVRRSPSSYPVCNFDGVPLNAYSGPANKKMVNKKFPSS